MSGFSTCLFYGTITYPIQGVRKEKPMLTPDITIMPVGTEITYGEDMIPDEGWEEYLNNKWDRTIVVDETMSFSELKLQVCSATCMIATFICI